MTLPNLPDQMLVAAFIKAWDDAIKDAREIVRPATQEALDKYHIKGITAVLPNGTEVADIVATNPKPTAQMKDEKAFTRWVAEHFPNEIVQAVRESFTKKILDDMTKRGTAEIINPETGEIITVPGVELATSRVKSHMVKLTDGAKEAIAAAWRNGELAHIEGLPALMAGDDQ